MEESKLAELALADDAIWEDPVSLTSETVYGYDYPTSCLSQTIQNAVNEFLEFTQVPEALAGSVGLAAATLSCQHTADVVLDSQKQFPISLYFLIQQNTGERKSTVSRYFLKALEQWEDDQHQESHVDEDGFDHHRLKYEDSTHESLIMDIASGRKSVALWSDEAALILGGTSLKENSALAYLGNLNKAFHGDKIVHRRKQAESAELSGYRLSCCLMMQEQVMGHLLNLGSKNGGTGLAEGTGFLTRFLFAAPKSIIGTRNYREAPDQVPMMEEFNKKILHHLNKPVPKNWSEIKKIRLTPDAKKLWIAEHDRIEQLCAPGNELEGYEGLASKYGEQIARISGVFCAFEDKEDQITPATMNSAIDLARWHFSEARRITGAGIINKELRNAIQLKDWLIDHFLENKSDHVTASHILNFGPTNLRNAKARDEALVILKKHGHVNLKEDFRSVLIKLNPKLIPSVANANLANLD